MKNFKLILFVLFVFLFLDAHAQIFIGGDFSFNSSHSKAVYDNPVYSHQSSGFNINLSPFIGKFISDKVAIGIAGDISSSNSKSSPNQTKGFGVGAHPFVRYYFVQWNKLSLYGVGMIGFNYTKSKNYNDGAITSTSTGNNFSVNFHPGLSYSITDKISFESAVNILSLGYDYYSSKNESSKHHRSLFNLSGGSNIGYFSIGAIYKF